MTTSDQSRPTDTAPAVATCPLYSESEHRKSKCDPPLRAGKRREHRVLNALDVLQLCTWTVWRICWQDGWLKC